MLIVIMSIRSVYQANDLISDELLMKLRFLH